MALVRWEPRSVGDLRSEIDQLFDRFWRRSGETDGLPMAAWHPTVDVAERDDAYVITADLPGMNREDISVKVTDNALTLSGERKSETSDEKAHRVERSYGRFSRSFALPSAVNEGEISAEYRNGVLTVALPKAEDTKPKQIPVS